VARLEGRLDEARLIVAETLEGVRSSGDRRCTVRMLTALARLALAEGNEAEAWERVTEALEVGTLLDRGLSSDTHEMVDTVALVALARGMTEPAVRWMGAAEAIRSRQGLHRSPPDQAEVVAALTRIEGALGEEKARDLYDRGSTLALDDVAAEVLELSTYPLRR
jgi:hypothetical protein